MCCFLQQPSSEFPVAGSSKEVEDKSKAPKWIEALIERQTASISAALSQQLSAVLGPKETVAPHSMPSTSRGDESLPSMTSSPPHVQDGYEEDDEFEARFGHLIGPSANTEAPVRHESARIGDSPLDVNSNKVDPAEDEASIDEDLLDVLDSVPNWDVGTAIAQFLQNNIDRPLPEEMLKQLSDDFTPKEDLQKYFLPPKMPNRLFNNISRMKSKNASRTEKALFNAQKELYIVSKPLIAALVELKPLGSAVSKARELMSISLRGLYSVALRISRARRENVRFLFKDALAEVLFGYDPNHSSLFGGSCFSSQIEKAAKEAKLDLSWPKAKPAQKYQPFRAYSSGQQGFYSQRASKYVYRRSSRGRQQPYQQRGNNNYNKYASKKTKGSSSKSRD